MRPPDTGPPEKDEGRVPNDPANVENPIATTPPNTAKHHQGGYRHSSGADLWRDGFGCGFRDALRLAARRIDDPAVWVVLDRLADDYDLAGGVPA
jgi:hypothetical protein